MKIVIKAILFITIIMILFSGSAFAKGTDKFEDNDTPQIAFEISLPFRDNIKLDEIDDEDWFKFTLDSRAVLRFNMNALNYTNLYIYTKEGVAIKDYTSIYETIYTPSKSVNVKLNAGEYYLRLKNYYAGTAYTQDINLNIEVLPEDSMENNDTWQSAYLYPLGEEKEFTLNGIGDVDWFKVVVDRVGALKVKTGDANGWINYKLYTEKEIKLSNPQPKYSKQLGYNDLQGNYKVEAGTYYIKLDKTGQDYFENPAKLMIDLLPEDSMEYNDTWEDAYLYTLGEKKEFAINAVNDIDWFKVVVNRTGALKVASAYDNGLNLCYELYTETSLESLNPQPIYQKINGGNFEYSYKVNSGTYYFKIKNYYGNEFSEKSGIIKIDLLPEDELEYNDTWKAARVYPLGEENEITLNAVNDQEWFKVVVDKRRTLKLGMECDSYFYRYIIYNLYTEDSIKSSNPQPILTKTLNYWNYQRWQINYKVEPGTYYINLKADGSEYFSEKGIRLLIDLPPEDEMENNDTWENAYSYPLGQEKLFTLNAENDEEWYKVELDRTGALKIKTEGSEINIYYELYTEEEMKNVEHKYIVYEPITNSKSSRKLDKGIYYMRLKNDGSNFSEKPIKLLIDLLPEDQMENNDVWQSAYQYPLGQEKEFTLNAVNDEDWFKVIVDKTAALKIKTAESDLNIKYELYTEDALTAYEPKALVKDVYISNQQYNMKVSDGIYYIRLSKDSYSTFSEKEIKLLIDLLPEDSLENNDTWQGAYSFPIGKERIISVNAINEVDWFKVELTKAATLKIRVEDPMVNGYYLYLGNSIFTEAEVKKENPAYLGHNNMYVYYTAESSYNALQPGIYYIKLQSNGNFKDNEIKLTIATEEDNTERAYISNHNVSTNSFDVYSNIEVKFSEPMDIFTLNKENVILKCFGNLVAFDIDYVEEDNKLILKPQSPLDYSSKYTLLIKDDVKARDNGFTLQTDFLIEFTTCDKKIEKGVITGRINARNSLRGLLEAGDVTIRGDNYSAATSVSAYGDFYFSNVPKGKYTVTINLSGFLSDSEIIEVTELQASVVELNPIFGDVNGDGIINIFDFTIFSKYFNYESE